MAKFTTTETECLYIVRLKDLYNSYTGCLKFVPPEYSPVVLLADWKWRCTALVVQVLQSERLLHSVRSDTQWFFNEMPMSHWNFQIRRVTQLCTTTMHPTRPTNLCTASVSRLTFSLLVFLIFVSNSSAASSSTRENYSRRFNTPYYGTFCMFN